MSDNSALHAAVDADWEPLFRVADDAGQILAAMAIMIAWGQEKEYVERFGMRPFHLFNVRCPA